MKKLVITALFLCSSAVYADELSTFSQVANSVAEGRPISFVINFEKCSSSQTPPFQGIASVRPNAVLVVGNSKITASDRHFTRDEPNVRGAPVFSYSKYTIKDDGATIVKFTIMNALNYEVLNSYQINCELGAGFKVFY